MKQKLNFILLTILILSVVFILLSTTLHYLSGGNIPFDYGITVDAGSSKTKFVLYDWSSVKNDTGFVNEIATKKLTDFSIDEYANDLPRLTGPLVTALNEITKKIEYTRKLFYIPIYLGATAGMRLLRAANNEDSDKILKEIRSSFEQYADSQKRFTVENVEIISGEKEGLYCWISTNYLMGFVPPEDRSTHSTVGILDMGGASAQIAFQTSCNTENGCTTENANTNLVGNEKTKLFGVEYDIYTYSNLCYGNDDARRRYQYVVILNSGSSTNQVEDPCTHPGQLDRTIIREKLLEDVCTNNKQVNEALIYPNYTFKIMPERPPLDMPFYALSTYYFSVSQLNKTAKDKIQFKDETELREAIEKYCRTPWADVVKNIGNEKDIKYKHNYCFAMNYMFMNLKHVYRFSDNHFNKIEFREKLNGHDLGWSLGYMLQATNTIPQGSPEDPILNRTQFIIISVIGLIMFLGVFFVFLKTKVYQKVFVEELKPN